MTASNGQDSRSKSTTEIVHLLPCKIDYVGPAPVAQYFDATRSTNGVDGTETASFRGRPLNGAEVPILENGYRLYKAELMKPIANGDCHPSPSNFQINGDIQRLMYWNLDKPTSATDPLPKLMQFLAGAKAFADQNAE